MEEKERLPRMLSVAQIRKHYLSDISDKKLRGFLLMYLPYKRIGNTYYFSRKKLEEFFDSEESIDFDVCKY